MNIGPSIRRRLGGLEAPMSRAYRGMFLDLDALGRELVSVDFGPRVLEVGVGDGLVAAQIVARRDDVELLGIDLVSQPGVLFDADPTRVRFQTRSTSDLLSADPTRFDAVVISDVLHHVPPEQRAALLADVEALLADDGVLLVKETVVTSSPGYWLGRFSDRWISGDRGVSFLSEPELDRTVRSAVSRLQLVARSTIRPWSANLLLAWRRGSEPVE